MAKPQRSAKQKRSDAQKEYPMLNATVVKMEACAQRSLSYSTGRYGVYQYLAFVLRKYREWKTKGKLKETVRRIRELRRVRAREDSRPLVQILSATSELSSKAVSKWATLLRKAEKEQVAPNNLQEFARKLRNKEDVKRKRSSKKTDGEWDF